eukprot:Gb_03358 [translate_table: standard]
MEDHSTQYAMDERKLGNASPTILTVWRKSLVLNCNGFTVYDSTGSLVFRVDDYASTLNDEVVLMDAAGKALITMRRKRLSLQDRWEGFVGSTKKPIFSVRRSTLPIPTKAVTYVFMTSTKCGKHSDYHIEGSYCKRSCTVYNSSRSIVAEVKRKNATSDVMLGDDVFSLVVQPGFDQAFIMGLIVILDHMIRKPIFSHSN